MSKLMSKLTESMQAYAEQHQNYISEIVNCL